MREKAIDNQDKQLAHMQAFVDRFRASAARASMAQSRLKAMSKIERLAPTAIDPAIVFNFPDPEPIGPVNVIQLIDVAFGYDPVSFVCSGWAGNRQAGPQKEAGPQKGKRGRKQESGAAKRKARPQKDAGLCIPGEKAQNVFLCSA